MGSRWKLLREPEPIPVGTAVMIPDFGFELGRRRIFLEIVGFWTSEYLARKISKLSMVRGVDLVVAVDSQLGISHKIPGNVITFEGEVPLKPILAYLEKVEREEFGRELEALSGLHIAAEGEYITIGDLATKHGVSKEAILQRLAITRVPGYTLVGEFLIKDSKLEELREAIEGESSFTALILRLERVGITDPYPLLQHFGYQVRWQGLNQDSAVIVPPKGKK